MASKKRSVEPEPEVETEAKATIVVNESVTLSAPGRKLITPSSLYSQPYYVGLPLTLDDVESFIRVVRRELRPELVSIRANDLEIVATQRTVVE